MAWLAVDEDGTEWIFSELPTFEHKSKKWYTATCVDQIISIPLGSIYKLIGHDLTWEDEPVEI